MEDESKTKKKKVNMDINNSEASSLEDDQLKTEDDFFDTGRSNEGVPKSTG